MHVVILLLFVLFSDKERAANSALLYFPGSASNVAVSEVVSKSNNIRSKSCVILPASFDSPKIKFHHADRPDFYFSVGVHQMLNRRGYASSIFLHDNFPFKQNFHLISLK